LRANGVNRTSVGTRTHCEEALHVAVPEELILAWRSMNSWELLRLAEDVPESRRATMVPFEMACCRAAEARVCAVSTALSRSRPAEVDMRAGTVREMRMTMIAMTMINSIRVKPPFLQMGTGDI